MEPIAEMRHITKRFSNAAVLDDVGLELYAGEVHALMGENGAGKSTLIKILAGVHQADAGEVRIDGRTVEIEGVRASQRLGISVIHQELSLVPTMTVAENIFLGRMPVTRLGFVDDKKSTEQTQQLLDRFGIRNITPMDQPYTLSVAQQQMIEILRALSINCKILIMDEPTASLTDKEIARLFEFIAELKRDGVAIVYISHRMDEIFQISDRITVLRDGRYIGTRMTSATDYEELVGMMVGREFKDVYPQVKGKVGEEVLRVKHLCRGTRVRDVSFHVRKGEVLGFYGLMGSGRTETMRIIYGVDRADSGEVYLEGESIRNETVRSLIRKGIYLTPEDRKEQGLILIQGIRYNISLSVMDQFIRGVKVDMDKESGIVERHMRMLDIKARDMEQTAATLSGGNQQKVVLSKCLATTPKVLVLDEPTRGIDIGAKHELYKLIADLAEAGVAVVLVSSELPEIIHLCTRVVVMHEGRVTGELDKDSLNEQDILKLALGGVAHVSK